MAKENPNLSPVEFEQRFFEEVEKNNKNIIIIDRNTIPKQSLRNRIDQRNGGRRRSGKGSNKISKI